MIIYKITNKINGKVYIGQTIRSLSVRWAKHCCKEKKNYAIQNAIQKYGKENFTVEEIDGANSLSELNYLEQHHIYINNCTAPNGYNLTSGGNNGGKRSEESKKKMSDAKRGKKRNPFSEIHLMNMSLSRINKPKKSKGNTSKGNKREPFTEEHKVKMSESCKGRVFTEEHRKKLSEAKKGKISNNKGKYTC